MSKLVQTCSNLSKLALNFIHTCSFIKLVIYYMSGNVLTISTIFYVNDFGKKSSKNTLRITEYLVTIPLLKRSHLYNFPLIFFISCLSLLISLNSWLTQTCYDKVERERKQNDIFSGRKLSPGTPLTTLYSMNMKQF